MLWGNTKNDIAQPPPTPGLASWAFNSIFNRQTPSSKYANLKQRKDDIEYTRAQTPRRIPKRFNDDTLLDYSTRKNVAWGGEDYKVRSRSSSFSEKPNNRRFVDDNGSIHNRDSNYFRDNELLPNDYSEYNTFHKQKNFSPVKTQSRFSTGSPQYEAPKNSTPFQKTSLPQSYPGKYPSPYVARNSSFDSNDDVLSSSAVRNFAKAKSNTRLNQYLDPTPPKNQRPPPQQPLFSRLRSSYYKKEPTAARTTAPSKQQPKDFLKYDEQLLLDSIDDNIAELVNITKYVDGLKLQRDDKEQIEMKYLEIRQELIQELKKSKKLYDSYYQFVNKYKELKKKYKEITTTENSIDQVKRLQKEIYYLQTDNDVLKKKLKEKELENDSTITDLKKTLNNSSNFEVTLRRKIKYLEDKIDQQQLDHKNEKFELNQKNFILEMKLRDEEELYNSNYKIANDRIRELERQLELKSSGINGNNNHKNNNISIIPEYTTSNNLNERHVSHGIYNDENNSNNDTINLLSKKYPDRKIDSIKHSPEKRYSTGNYFTKSTSSLNRDNDEKLFKNIDKIDESMSNSTFFRNGYKPNSMRSSSARNYPSTKRYSNPNFGDLTFNTSELG